MVNFSQENCINLLVKLLGDASYFFLKMAVQLVVIKYRPLHFARIRAVFFVIETSVANIANTHERSIHLIEP